MCIISTPVCRFRNEGFLHGNLPGLGPDGAFQQYLQVCSVDTAPRSPVCPQAQVRLPVEIRDVEPEIAALGAIGGEQLHTVPFGMLHYTNHPHAIKLNVKERGEYPTVD